MCGLPSKQRRIKGFQRYTANPDRFDVIDELTDKVCQKRWAPRLEPSTQSRFGSMPRYFFNTRIGDELIADPEGEELRDPDRAWEVARAMIRELLKTEGAERGLLNAILEVTDDEGEIVLEFSFTEAILDLRDASDTRH